MIIEPFFYISNWILDVSISLILPFAFIVVINGVFVLYLKSTK